MKHRIAFAFAASAIGLALTNPPPAQAQIAISVGTPGFYGGFYGGSAWDYDDYGYTSIGYGPRVYGWSGDSHVRYRPRVHGWRGGYAPVRYYGPRVYGWRVDDYRAAPVAYYGPRVYGYSRTWNDGRGDRWRGRRSGDGSRVYGYSARPWGDRPASCGTYRYWNGRSCVDIRSR